MASFAPAVPLDTKVRCSGTKSGTCSPLLEQRLTSTGRAPGPVARLTPGDCGNGKSILADGAPLMACGQNGVPPARGRLMQDDKLTDEQGRLAALRRYEILDTAEEAPFQRIVELVRT